MYTPQLHCVGISREHKMCVIKEILEVIFNFFFLTQEETCYRQLIYEPRLCLFKKRFEKLMDSNLRNQGKSY